MRERKRERAKPSQHCSGNLYIFISHMKKIRLEAIHKCLELVTLYKQRSQRIGENQYCKCNVGLIVPRHSHWKFLIKQNEIWTAASHQQRFWTHILL